MIADDRADHGRGGGSADACRTALRTQSKMAPDKSDKGAEHERLEATYRELGSADRVLGLRRVGGRGHIQKRHRDAQAAEHRKRAPIDKQQRHQQAEGHDARKH